MSVHYTSSAAETISLGRRLARLLRPGDVVAFNGELGAGKTTMIKGLAAELGVAETVKSPSFVIITQYAGSMPVFHIDLYRVGSGLELEDIGLEECFDGEGVSLVEWADRTPGLLPDRTVSVSLVLEGDGRRIAIAGDVGLSPEILE